MSSPLAPRLRNGLRRFEVTDLLLAALVGLVVVAIAPSSFAPRWTPRAVLYLGIAPAGTVALYRLLRIRDRAAVAATAFLAVAVVAALVSSSPLRSILPTYYRHESVTFWLAALGVWALVRTRSSAGGRLVEHAFVVAVGVTILAGIVQLIVDARTGTFAMIGRRASGLSLNPVYFGGLSAGAMAWCARTLHGEGEPAHRGGVTGLLVLSTIGVWISGSRIALLSVIFVLTIALVRDPRRTARFVAPSAALGIALGEFARWLNRTMSGGSTTSATGRLGGAEVASGLGVRREVWGFDLAAFWRRPVLGHGAGNHASAIQPHHTADFVARTDPDELLNNWSDAHNIVLELLVVVGVVGLVAAVAFIAVQLRSLAGPAAWAATAISLTWLLQPVSLVTLIPVLALVGAAWSSRPERPILTEPQTPSRSAVVSMLLGVLAAGWLIVGDTLLLRAEEERTISAGQLAAAWWWHDPMSAREAAVLGLREAVTSGDPSDAEAVLELARATTARDPQLAFWWVHRGDIESIFDRDAEARSSYERALEHLPWSPVALASLLELEDDPARRLDLERRLDQVTESNDRDR